MSRGRDSLEEWNGAFKECESKPDFQLAKEGKINLTDKEVDTLLEYGLAIREDEVSRSYSRVWTAMKLNEKLGVLSLYFNGAALLVGSKTNFFRDMNGYYGLNSDTNSCVESGSDSAVETFV